MRRFILLLLLSSLFAYASVFASEPSVFEYKLSEKGRSGQLIVVNAESYKVPVEQILVSVLTVDNKSGHTCEFRGKENTAARITSPGHIDASFNVMDSKGNITNGTFEMIFEKNKAVITKADVSECCGLNGNPLGRWVKLKKL